MPGKHNAGGCGCCESYSPCWGCPLATAIIATGFSTGCVSPPSVSDLDGTYILSTLAACLWNGVGGFIFLPGCGEYDERAVLIDVITENFDGFYHMNIEIRCIGYIGGFPFRSEIHYYALAIVNTDPCPTGNVSIPFDYTVITGADRDPLEISVPTMQIVFP